MHDMIGSAGMLRGWVAMSMQMLWILATLAVSVGAAALVELLITSRTRHRRQEVPRIVPAVVSSYRSQPLL